MATCKKLPEDVELIIANAVAKLVRELPESFWESHPQSGGSSRGEGRTYSPKDFASYSPADRKQAMGWFMQVLSRTFACMSTRVAPASPASMFNIRGFAKMTPYDQYKALCKEKTEEDLVRIGKTIYQATNDMSISDEKKNTLNVGLNILMFLVMYDKLRLILYSNPTRHIGSGWYFRVMEMKSLLYTKRLPVTGNKVELETRFFNSILFQVKPDEDNYEKRKRFILAALHVNNPQRIKEYDMMFHETFDHYDGK